MPEPFELLSPAVQHHIVNDLGWPSLRPLQQKAIEPLLRGHDALLLAPTAGGKTEAALFPLLSRMSEEQWQGTSILYICPLKALLNNLEPRLAQYTGWLGRTAAVRHGDVGASVRRRQALHRPDVLLTTPESLESMLISTTTDPHRLFGDVRAVVIDEVHAFAGDDRGWHLLGVLERIARLAGTTIQRVGLSATVGNGEDLLTWLQGGAKDRPATLVSPGEDTKVVPEFELDFVGSITNAATVIAGLHRGEKRLVFADSRRTVETLALNLHQREVETHVSHSSLSADARRRAETAFAEGQNCVITATSTLELGIDVGDLDRVIQIGAPSTVASMLQRLGRTGRREGSSRNMLFLATDHAEFLRACGLLLLWSEGYVEPVIPPPSPRHVAAQQLLGLVLQQRHIGRNQWRDWFGELELATASDWQLIHDWLLEQQMLDEDGGMIFVGPEAHRRYGRVHFRDLMAVFTADPQVTIMHGQQEVGAVDPMLLQRKVEGPRLITLAGRAWKVTYVDWNRHKAFVEPSQVAGDVRWLSLPQPSTYALSNAVRRVLLGVDPRGVNMTRRALRTLEAMREEFAHRVSEKGSVVTAIADSRMRWWTWAGARANAVLVSALVKVDPTLFESTTAFDNWQIGLRSDADPHAVVSAIAQAKTQFGHDLSGVDAQVDEKAATRQLKFAELLPPPLMLATIAERMSEHEGVAAFLENQRVQIEI